MAVGLGGVVGEAVKQAELHLEAEVEFVVRTAGDFSRQTRDCSSQSRKKMNIVGKEFHRCGAIADPCPWQQLFCHAWKLGTTTQVFTRQLGCWTSCVSVSDP